MDTDLEVFSKMHAALTVIDSQIAYDVDEECIEEMCDILFVYAVIIFFVLCYTSINISNRARGDGHEKESFDQFNNMHVSMLFYFRCHRLRQR